MSPTRKRFVLVIVLGLGFVPLYFAGAKPPDEAKNQVLIGKVVRLTEMLGKFAKIDEDAALHFLALACVDGKVYPLIKDDGSRMFFKDAKLLNRSLRITGRLHPQTRFLQVIHVNSEIKGQLYDIYYWCDICTIKAFEPGDCGCCGAPYEFREVPAK